MMAERRKMGPVRQMSLQSEPTVKSAQPARRLLRKQFSEDVPDAKDFWSDAVKSIRLASSAKNRQKTADRPPTAKLAWAEKRQSSLDERNLTKECSHADNDSLITKKCNEVKRPVTAKLKKQNSVEKDSILYEPQELADRLRKTFSENREQSKTNLNIFLAHNTRDKIEDELEELTDTETYTPTGDYVPQDKYGTTKMDVSPKIMSPLQPDLNVNNFKNIFQKQIKRTSRVRLILESENAYTPSTKLAAPPPLLPKEETRPNLNVVIPSSTEDYASKSNDGADFISEAEAPTQHLASELDRNKELASENASADGRESEASTPVSQPVANTGHPILQRAQSSVATSRREAFQRRTNTAFTGSVAVSAPSSSSASSRPPLVRALSVPTKPSPSGDSSPGGEKSKFLTRVKRRIKSVKKRGDKETAEDFEFLSELGEDDFVGGDESSGKQKASKNKMRYVPPSHEVETMVSLVSPTVSDNEDGDKDGKGGSSSGQSSPSKMCKDGAKNSEVKTNLAAKKSGKTVSFQQHHHNNHAAPSTRSFSANYPYRRHSTVTSLMFGITPGPPALKNSAAANANNEREKRSPGESPHDDIREAKRRLVRTKSAPFQKSMADATALELSNANSEKPGTPQEQNATSSALDIVHAVDDVAKGANPATESTEQDKPPEIKFNCEKEKECWEMYVKMSEKGVSVNYDTLLRGMLTPTEYRMRRKEVPSTC